MKPWDIYTYAFGEAGPHPAVIVSHPDRVAKAEWVNVLFCTTQRANRPPNNTIKAIIGTRFATRSNERKGEASNRCPGCPPVKKR